MYWKKFSHQEIKDRILNALNKNLDYQTTDVLGYPATNLDPEVFYRDTPFLKDAPYMQTMVANPNHIGCHTLTEAEPAFDGTQEIERELIDICAREIFKAEENAYDGYVASGGTEANIQALWILRNYYLQKENARHEQIAVVYSEDTHYSISKGVNLLNIRSVIVPVDQETRQMTPALLQKKVREAQAAGCQFFILVLNMSTTMFGSVDDLESATATLDKLHIKYHVHIDGAYGGFIYPFTHDEKVFTFMQPRINSFSLDAHKLVQSPYGTGIFVVRKGMMPFVLTQEARYVKGKDYTLVGSRSGANAIAVWMILRTYGSDGWKAKIGRLIDRTDRLCDNLRDRGIPYFRHPQMNIIAIPAKAIPEAIVHQFMLVPDTHDGHPQWYKIVVMDHVTQGKIDKFLFALDELISRP